MVNCFNSDIFLKETFETLLSQNYDNYSIIVIDNCSTDKTPKIVKDYMRTHEKIFYHKLKVHCTLVEARIKGLDYVLKNHKFDYLGFCDSDDLWDKNWINSLISLNHSASYDILYCNGYERIMKGSNFTLVPVEKSLSTMPRDAFTSPLYLQSMLVSSSLCKRMLPNILDSRLSMHSDIDFLHRAVKVYKASYAQSSLYLFQYRVHGTSLSKRSSKQTRKERLLIAKKFDFALAWHYFKQLCYDIKINVILNRVRVR